MRTHIPVVHLQFNSFVATLLLPLFSLIALITPFENVTGYEKRDYLGFFIKIAKIEFYSSICVEYNGESFKEKY